MYQQYNAKWSLLGKNKSFLKKLDKSLVTEDINFDFIIGVGRINVKSYLIKWQSRNYYTILVESKMFEQIKIIS